MKKRNTILTSSISLLILLSALMMISYVHLSSKSMGVPFYMSHYYIKLNLSNSSPVPIDLITDLIMSPIYSLLVLMMIRA